MTTKPFAAKTAETLRQEIITKYEIDPDLNKDLIDKMVVDRLKDEEMKASLHDSKEKKKKTIAEREAKLKELGYEVDPKTGELVKKEAPKGDEKPNGTDEAKVRQWVAEENFLAQGGTHTDLRQLHKIMAATGKSFVDAQKDSLFIAFQEKQEREQTSRNAQLKPSRGGSFAVKTEEDEVAKKNEGNLPPGFSAEKKKN